MRSVRLRFAVALLVAAAAHAAALPELWQAVAAGPALLSNPGLGWARLARRDRVGRELLAVWVSLAVLVPVTLVVRAAGLGGWALLVAVSGVGALGLVPPSPRPSRRGAWVLLTLGLTAAAVWTWRDTLARPLEGYWYDAHVDAGWDGAAEIPHTGGGFRSIVPLPGGARAYLPAKDHVYWLGPFSGSALVLLQGPIGATLDVDGDRLEVRADVTEDAEEGPVPRYLDRGVASRLVTGALANGQRLELTVSDPSESVVLVVPDAGAVWELHGAGLLRHAHYYQLLNMVEQLRWVRELGAGRWVTDVQPPLWTWVLAGPLTFTGGDLVTANVVLGYLLLALTLAGLAALRAWAPEAPAPAWLLPAAAAAVHAKLLYEPGSADLPDTLYTFAAVSAFAALGERGAFATLGLAAQLARYPGTLLVALLAAFAGDLRALRRLGLVVAGTAAAFGIVGAATGALAGWLETAWSETGPEHWHGEGDPAVLLARVPAFYGVWLAYAGGTPLLAVARWPRGTRTALGAAFTYSLLLATIDHMPSHYFLPLLHLSALALGCSAAAVRRPAARWLLAGLGLAGLFITWTRVPVVG